jgi:hypothetical protein
MVSIRELYPSGEVITAPFPFPRLIINVSKSSITRSRYFFISFRKSLTLALSMAFFMYMIPRTFKYIIRQNH